MSRYFSRSSLSPLGPRFRIPSIPSIVLIALVVAIVVWQLDLIGDYRVDDAYITFAYAKNFATGKGLTFGDGLRVEGYSNFLWTIVASAVQLVAPEHLYEGMRVMGFACLAAIFYFAYQLSARFGSKRLAWAPVLLLAFTTDFTGAVQSALESIPYTAALVVTTYVFLREDRARRRLSGWGFLLLCLTRIDGFVHVAFFLGWVGLEWLLERRSPRAREVVAWLAAPALVYVAYFAWRYSYYGLPLPTTYYAKSLIHELMPNRGQEYVMSAVTQLGLIWIGLFALVAVVRRPRRPRLLLTALVAYHFAYISYVGGDWMSFHRFLLPVLPLLAVLGGWGALEIWNLAGRLPWPARVPIAAVLLACGAYLAMLADGHSLDTPEEEGERGMRLHTTRHTKGLLDAAYLFKWMARNPGDKVVTDYGGVFGYFANDAYLIEMWGLCNAEIALRGDASGINPIYGKTCIECYAEFQPDYFHANVPLVKTIDAYSSQYQVVGAIFQSGAIGSVLNFSRDYVTGRVVNRSRNEAFYFIERRRPGLTFETRHPAPGIDVEYPFLAQ